MSAADNTDFHATSTGVEWRTPQPPDADRQERQDEDREQDVGERAVAVGDQRNQAERLGHEHAADEQDQRDRQPRAVRQRACRACACQAWSTRSLIACTALVPLSSSAEKIITWNSKWNAGMPIR